jgi:hypothetical protein
MPPSKNSMGKAYLGSPKSIGIWQDEQEGEEQDECGGQVG